MGKEKNNKDKKDSDIKLIEGTASKFKDATKNKKRVCLWIDKSYLDYEAELKKLQRELMKLQLHINRSGERILLLFEGRDAAGKGGTIKRFTAFLNPRGARVMALGKPNETEQTQWYFQRYVTHLPAGGEIVFFDRSWYNRSMVEPVMGFCTDEQNKRFLKDVPLFEEMLVKDGIRLFKFYFSVSRAVQKKRFDSRKTDPLKQYKLSPVDNLAQKYWDQYTLRKFQMLSETNRTLAPWTIVRSNNKKKARLNCMKFFLSQVEYKNKIDPEEFEIDPEIIISGIDELKFMEDNLMTATELPG